MKAKIINQQSNDYGKTFKVRRMNYNEIIVNYSDEVGIKKFLFEEVECIKENKIDEFLINNREFLKIKLKRGISVIFYNALYETLKIEIKEDITRITVLKDRYSINKRGIWQKELILFINDKYPVNVLSSGQNFKTTGYDIVINLFEEQDFLNICHVESEHIRKQIDMNNDILEKFNSVIDKIKLLEKCDYN